MLKSEFEKIAGYQVSNDDYKKIIEPMYMATSLNKEEFVKTLNKKRFALRSINAILREMRAIARHLEGTCTNYTDQNAYDQLHEVIEEYMKRKGYINNGIKLAGHQLDTAMKQCCYYPKTVIIYGFKDYKTIETINLIN